MGFMINKGVQPIYLVRGVSYGCTLFFGDPEASLCTPWSEGSSLVERHFVDDETATGTMVIPDELSQLWRSSVFFVVLRCIQSLDLFFFCNT